MCRSSMLLILLGIVAAGCARDIAANNDPRVLRRQRSAIKDGAVEPAVISLPEAKPATKPASEPKPVTEAESTKPVANQPIVRQQAVPGTQQEGRRDPSFILAAGDREWSRAMVDQILEKAAPLLHISGQEIEGSGSRRFQQLEGMVQQCRALQPRLGCFPEKLELFSLELQMSYALALGATDPRNVDRRIADLRDTVDSVKRLDGIEAEELARFWLLQADLLAMRVQSAALDGDQFNVISRLEGFLQRSQLESGVFDDASDEKVVNPALFSMLRAVKLALLNLYDQVGLNRQACELAQQLKAVRYRFDGVNARGDLDRVLGYCKLLGQRFEARIQTELGDVWSSNDYLGGPILLHFWASWAKPSTQVVGQLREKYAQLHGQGLNILSIQLGCGPEAGDQSLAVEWATCVQGDGHPDFAKLFQITSLPRFAVIDGEGYVRAIGSTLGVLRTIDRLNPPASTTDDGLATKDRAADRPTPSDAPRVLEPINRPVQQSPSMTRPESVPTAE